jgi:hypothetical protein
MACTTKSIAAPFGSECLEHRVDGGDVFHVAIKQQFRVDRIRQRLDPPPERLALIGERQFRSGVGQLLGDAPGD